MDIELIYKEATEGSHMDGGDGIGCGVTLLPTVVILQLSPSWAAS
jgi:hypothetical protein